MADGLDTQLTRSIIQRTLNYFRERIAMSHSVSAPTDLQDLAELLKVLAEPKRLLIINLLMEGVQCNCELGDALQMAPNLISHHLSVLRQAGWVDVERDTADARWIYYSVNREKVAELRELLMQFLDPDRMRSRRPDCGPQSPLVTMVDAENRPGPAVASTPTSVEPCNKEI
jgi:ArsR family transcriptional regulator